MLFEIKVEQNMKDGRTIKESYIAEDYEMTTKSGLDAVKFHKQGKAKFTWVEVPNKYQMEKFVESFKIEVCEATTGRKIYTIAK